MNTPGDEQPNAARDHIAATPPMPPYAPARDPSLWFICLAATLAAMWASDTLRPPDSAANFGTLAAGFLLSLAFTLLLGLVGLKICQRTLGRKPIASRAAFALGACLGVALLALGEYRIRSAQAHLPAANQGAPKRPTVVSKAESDRLITDEGQAALSAAASRSQQYATAVAKVIGDGLIRPNQLDTPEKLAALKAKVARLRQLADGFDIDTRAAGEATLARVQALPIDESEKRAFEVSYRQSRQRSQAIADESLSLSHQTFDALEELARFISDRLGTFHLEDNDIVFKSAADVAGYKQIVTRLVELDKRQQEVTTRAQKQMGELTHGTTLPTLPSNR
jgi:hypothetical protein